MGCVMVQILLHQFKGYDTEDGDFFYLSYSCLEKTTKGHIKMSEGGI